jgi:hypothetical protein
MRETALTASLYMVTYRVVDTFGADHLVANFIHFGMAVTSVWFIWYGASWLLDRPALLKPSRPEST